MPDSAAAPLQLLSVVIPAYNEEGCICSTVEHLHLELRLRNVPHEIVVVDDGSTDSTWQKLLELKEHMPELAPVRNEGQRGFGRAVTKGLDNMKGDAVVNQVAKWKEGTFEINFSAPKSNEKSTETGTQGLLMEAMRLLDEENR